MDEMEESFQRCLNSYSIEEKRIPVEISKKRPLLPEMSRLIKKPLLKMINA